MGSDYSLTLEANLLRDSLISCEGLGLRVGAGGGRVVPARTVKYRIGYAPVMLMGPGSFVRSVRRRHGLTQAELARRVGTSRASIARLEADGVSPTIATLEKILLAVGEELELSCVRRPLPRDDDAELITEMGRPMAERLRSALVANDRSKLMSGILADDPP